MGLGDVVYKANERIQYVYFPETVVLSFIVGVSDGPSVEAAMAGAEGMAGLAAINMKAPSGTLCVCQVAGNALRMKASVMRRMMQTMPQFGELVHRYVIAFIAQVSQTAACNRHHTVSQRCARWILMTHDRVEGSQCRDSG